MLPCSMALTESLRFLLSLPTCRPAYDFPRLSCPFNGIPLVSPIMKRAVHSRLGSALRLSQPLSGFLATPGLRGLVSCRNRSWDLPPECSPRKDRRASRRRLAPLPLSTRLPWRAALVLSPLVSPTPTLSRSCLVPPATMSSLSTCPKARFPVALDSNSETALYSALHRLRSLDPLTNPFAIDSSCPSPTADTLLGFSPLKLSPTTPRSLDPPEPRGLEHSPFAQAYACDQGSRPRGLPRPRRTSSTPPTG
jgi:hypothetical protein